MDESQHTGPSVPLWTRSPGAQHSPLHQPRLMCFHVRSPHPAAPREPPWLQILVCEGATGLLHTVAFTALLTCSPGIEQSQGSRSWGHFCSHNPLLHPESPAPSSQSQACPILCPFLTPSQVSSLQFSKSQCKPGSYQVFIEDPCHSILAK